MGPATRIANAFASVKNNLGIEFEMILPPTGKEDKLAKEKRMFGTPVRAKDAAMTVNPYNPMELMALVSDGEMIDLQVTRYACSEITAYKALQI